MTKLLFLTIAVLATALVFTGFMLIRYKRQIKKICRQLAFHNQNKTNQEIRIDVTTKEIKALQEEINSMFEQCNQLEVQYQNSEETLKELVTNISHDIRTPLTSINGYFQLMCDSEDEKERAKYEQIITTRIASISMLLEQFFTYVRIQNGGLSVNTSLVDLKQSLCENLFSFYEDFTKKGIVPNIDLPKQPCFANLDSDLFTRVLQNILKNALVHGDSKINVSLFTVQGQVVLQVKNHTTEAHASDISMVFERFYKSDSARKLQSSGLGLCIAKELVVKMEGSIRAFYEGEFFGVEIVFSERERNREKDSGN